MSDTTTAPAERYYILIDDPHGTMRRGQILTEAEARAASVRRAALMPLDPDALGRSGMAGYVARDFGDGIAPGNNSGPFAPFSIYLPHGDLRLHWRACLVRPANARSSGTSGILRLATDPAQAHTQACGLAPTEAFNIETAMSGESRKDESWVIGASQHCSLESPGHVGFMLWGHGFGVKVLWVACSATRA